MYQGRGVWLHAQRAEQASTRWGSTSLALKARQPTEWRGELAPALTPGAPPPSAARPCCLDNQSDAFSLATSAAPTMADEGEMTAQTKKVIRIQRVFINLLDSYSSRNIGKVSGCPGPQTQRGPEPWGCIRASPETVPSSWAWPVLPVCIQATQAPHVEAGSSLGLSPVNEGKLRLRGRKQPAQDHIAS